MKFHRSLIVGTGISGLRSAFALLQNPDVQVTLVDKSTSVGGRMATRRFGENYVNHGAENFDGILRVWDEDPFLPFSDPFPGRATDFAKKLRDELLTRFDGRVEFRFSWEASVVKAGQTLQNSQGESLGFDSLIVTAPVPQSEKILSRELPKVQYDKSLLFIGEINSLPIRLEMGSRWSELMFERKEQEIHQEAEVELGRSLTGLSLKKWRYARVKKGVPQSFYSHSDQILVAGDAFDPRLEFNLGSSWLSGLSAGNEVLKRIL